MHHRTPVRQRGRCGQVLARAFAQLIQRGEDNLIGVGIFALRVIEHVEAVKQLVELLVDFAKRQRTVNAQLRRRGLLAQAAAKPDFGRQVAHAVENHAVVVGVIAFNQHQYRFRLVKAGEVPEIAALAIGIFAVSAARHFRRSKN